MNPTSSPASLRWATLLSFFLPLALYALTAARSVQGGDTGEFGTIGMLGGVAHPPGYPLYTLLARGASHIPFGPAFWRIAMASALCGAAACAVLLHLLLRVTGKLEASLVAALAFGLSPLAWRLAGVPEVFSMHALFCCVAMLLSLSLSEATTTNLGRRSGFLGLTLGLSMANHQTTVLLAPLVAWAFLAAWKANGWKGIGGSIALAVAGAIAGLSAYLLLPLFARSAPIDTLAWGRTDTWDGLVTHMLRKEYGTLRLNAGAGAEQTDPVRHILDFLKSLPREYAILLAPAGLFGLYLLPRQRRGFGVALLLSFVLAGFVFIGVFNLPKTPINEEVAERFHLMPNLLFAVFVAVGLAEFQRRVRLRLFVLTCAATLLLGAASAGVQANWARDRSTEQFLKAQVESTLPGSAILGWADTNGPGITWVTRVLKDRPDVHYIDVNLMSIPWYAARKQRELPDIPLGYTWARRASGVLGQAYAAFKPVYVIPWTVEEASKTATLQPNGFLHRVMLPGAPPTDLAMAEQRLETATRMMEPLAPPIDAWAEMVHIAAGLQWLRLAEDFKNAGRADKYEELGHRALDILPPGWAEGGSQSETPPPQAGGPL